MLLRRRNYIVKCYRLTGNFNSDVPLLYLLYCDLIIYKAGEGEYYIILKSDNEDRINIAIRGLEKSFKVYPMRLDDLKLINLGSYMGLHSPIHYEICPQFNEFIGVFVRKTALILGRELEKRLIKYARAGIDMGSEKSEILKRISSLKQYGICLHHNIIVRGMGLKDKDFQKIIQFKPIKKWYISPLDLQIFLFKNMGEVHENIFGKTWR
ncbi:MAG TPA: hypothetical protein ENG40_00730 [Thermoprotei archaeon]|nr:hypothetical protein [Thermoprotei archaeon]